MGFEVVGGAPQQPAGGFEQGAAAAAQRCVGGRREAVGSGLHGAALSVPQVELRGDEIAHVERQRRGEVFVGEVGMVAGEQPFEERVARHGAQVGLLRGDDRRFGDGFGCDVLAVGEGPRDDDGRGDECLHGQSMCVRL